MKGKTPKKHNCLNCLYYYEEINYGMNQKLCRLGYPLRYRKGTCRRYKPSKRSLTDHA